MRRRHARVSERLRGRFWAVPVEMEVDEELAAHLELTVRRFIEQGMDPQAARAAALQRFGDLDRVRDECRDIRHDSEANVRRTELRQELRMDAWYALRALRKNPLFTAIAVLTIAVAIGANTAIFSVVNAVLLSPLPYDHAGRTVVLWNDYAPGLSHAAISPPEYFDIREQSRAFDATSPIRPQRSAITGDGSDPEWLNAYVVAPNFFDLLGTRPLLGRGFRASDGAADAASVIVLSHGLWMRRFGGDPAVLDRTVTIAGRTRTIVGVMPPGVRFPDAPIGFLRERADLWIASTFEQLRGDERGNQYLGVIARTQPGVTDAQLRADFAAIEKRFQAEFPSRYAPPSVPNWSLAAVPVRDMMIGDVKRTLAVLAGAVGLVLLIACVNVANLLLARGALRQREMAVRMAIGAGRFRLVRQLLTESVILGLLGGALGIALAWVGRRALVALAAGNIPRLDGASMNLTVLLFSFGVSIVAGLLVGLFPALQQSTGDLRSTLSEGARGSGDGRARRRLRTSLVVAQVAMALVLLIGAGLLGRSFLALQRVDTGFTADSVVAMQVALRGAKYDTRAKVVGLFDRLGPEVAGLPGVSDASLIYPLPMSGEGWSGTYRVDGEPSGPTDPQPHGEYAVSTPGYFKLMRIGLVAGRDFAGSDAADAPGVVVVDERLAARHWPGQSALGRRINVTGRDGDWRTVIGVVRHVYTAGPQEEGEPQLYFPLAQWPQSLMFVVARTTTPPTALTPSLRRAVRALDPDLPVTNLRSVSDIASAALSRQRFNTLLLAVFALAALALASVGLYGVMSYLVSQRTREIGVRVALGALPNEVRGLVVRESLLIAAGGVVVGVAASLALSRVVAGLLYGVMPVDVPTYASITGLLLLVALSAAYGPARRATRIDPVTALRE